MSRTVIADVRDLDWAAATESAKRLTRICEDAGFTAPEALDLHRDKVRRVCMELDQIVAALKITPPGGAS